MTKAEIDRRPSLLLLFTYKISLQAWERQGLLSRELRYYEMLQDQGLGSVALMTYGVEDADYQSSVSPFVVLPKRGLKRNWIYSLLGPFVHWSAFRSVDIIKSNQSLGAWTGLVAKLLMPRKLFIVRCGWIRTDQMMRQGEHRRPPGIWLSKLIEWLCFRFSDAIFVPSPPDKEYVQSTYRIDAGKINLIPTSVDTDVFVPSDRLSEWEGAVKLMSVGRQVEMKNFQSLILAAKGLDRPAEIVLVGDGPYRETLVRLSEEEQVPVTFLPFTPNKDLPRHLQEANIFVMPQLFGTGLSKVMLEAMSCGLITIGSDIEAHRQVLTDGINGLLCAPDAASIQRCLERVLSTDPTTLTAISRRARQDILDNYSMQANTRKELEILASLRD